MKNAREHYIFGVLKFDLKMKLTSVLLFLCLFQINANTYSQKTKLSLDIENKSIESVLFDTVEKETDFKFFYENSSVDLGRKVTFKIQKARISEILELLLKGTDIKYDILNKQIILTKRKVIPISDLTPDPITQIEVKTDQSMVRGTVSDSNGQPLPGASIIEKGTTNGTQTDFDGNFTLELSSDDAILVISYVGFVTQEIQVGGQSTIAITMAEDTAALEEVVVVAYGTQKKTNVTSSVTPVEMEELGEITTPNIGAALQGRAPGLFIRDSGYNEGLSFLVRGATTIGNNSPLFIVDGIPQDALTVDPNDIENITVLKDGAASAIYGSRAAAGVILITTRGGRQERFSLNYETFASWGKLTTLQEATNSVVSARIMNEASLNSGGEALFTPEEIGLFEAGTDHVYANTDWKDEALKTELTQRHYLSATGGNEKTSYFFSLAYRNANGIFVKGIDRTQYSLRTNLRTDLRDNLELGVNLSYIITDNTAPSVNNGIDNIYTHLNSTAPFLPVRQSAEPDAPFAFLNQAGAYGRGFWNVLWELEAGSSNTVGKNFTVNTDLTWELVDGLKLIGRYSGVFFNRRNVSNIFKRSTTNGPPWFSDINSLSQRYDDNRQLNAQTFLNYEKEWDKHYLGVLAGWDVQFDKNSFISAGRRAFQSDDLLTEFNAPNSGDNDDISNLSSNTFESALQSAVGRINYNFAEKYLLEISGRYDGSSIFAPETRYGFFPAVSAGWMISEEDFFNSKTFDYLKLRGSYGVSGNNRVSGSYFSTLLFDTYFFGDGSVVGATATEGGIPFRDLKWETTKTTDIGLDFSVGNGVLSGSLDFYRKITDDILLPSPVAGTVGTGRSGPAINAGSVKNTGFELSLTHNNSIGEDFGYSVSLNGTYNKNEILELTESFSEFDTNYRVGDPFGAIYGFEADGILSSQAEVDAYNAEITSGINPNTSPGDIRYKDINGDGRLDFEDNVLIAETLPKVTWGLNLSADWKNFDVQAFLQGVGGNQLRRFNDLFGNFSWIPEEAADAWSPQNPNGTYPRLLLFGQQTYFDNFYTASDYWVFNAAYLRLKNLQIGYTLPLRNDKLFRSVRLFVTGTNLVTISDFRPGFDPESNNFSIPPLKTYALGLNVKF